jgi:hypothetical protein
MKHRVVGASFLARLVSIAMLPAGTALGLQGGNIMPEYAQFEPVDAPDIVNLNTGDFSYTIPLGEVPGPYGGFPLSMSYHAGIGPEQEATWVGLGWTLNPGAINRTLRGAPDDQFHGGELSFIYSYSKKSSWGVGFGYEYGPFSLNINYNSNSGVGFNAGIGTPLSEFAGAKVTVGTDGVGLSIGTKNLPANVSVNGSIGWDGSYRSSGVGFSAGGASFGVQHQNGQGITAQAGMSVNSGPVPIGFTLSANSRGGSGSEVSVAGVSRKSFGIGISANNGAVQASFQSDGFAIPIPTPYGIFSFSYHQDVHETWLRQAGSENISGYMYQAGPAIFADAKTQDVIPDGSSGSGGTQGPIPWTWNYKGRTMDRVGDILQGDLHPGYDLYAVAANGVGGTFRPYGLTQHKLLESVELLN